MTIFSIELFFKYYTPFIFSVIAIAMLALRKFEQGHSFPVEFLGFKFQITSSKLIRLLLVAASVLPFAYYADLDVSQYFKQNAKMSVYFDQAGISKSLDSFSDEDKRNVGYDKFFAEANTHLVSAYYSSLDEVVKKSIGLNAFFAERNGAVYGAGKLFFRVEKKGGFQNYRIVESSGELTHKVERKGERPVEFLSFFEEVPSRNSHIRPSLWELISNQSVLLMPTFKQTIAEKRKSDGFLFDHMLIAMTKMHLLPYPHATNTIYFLAASDGKKALPVAYAIYE